jgi:protease IV
MLSLDGQLDEAAALDLLSELKALPSTVEDLGVVILRIRVGGGSLGAAQAVVEGLETIRLDLSVPVVAVVTETALSAGFFVAMACDRVVATSAATLGGCGAIVRRLSLDGVLGRVGIAYSAFSSGSMKDSLFPLSEVHPSQEENLRNLVADHADQFLAFVKDRRGADESVMVQIADGQLLSGRRALDLRLVDENGSLFSALTAAAALISADSLRLQVVESNQASNISGPVTGIIDHLLSVFKR